MMCCKSKQDNYSLLNFPARYLSHNCEKNRLHLRRKGHIPPPHGYTSGITMTNEIVNDTGR